MLPVVGLCLLIEAAITAPDEPTRRVGSVEFALLDASLVAVAIMGVRARILLLKALVGLGTAGVGVALLSVTQPPKGPVAELLGLVARPATSIGEISPNTVGYLAAPAVLGAVALAVRLGAVGRAVWTFVALCALTLLAATGARTSIAALGLAGAVGVAMRVKRQRALAGIVVAAVLIGIFTVDAAPVMPSVTQRFRMWSYILRLEPSPVSGMGFGAFAVRQFGSEEPVELEGFSPLAAHNLYVQTFVDFGLLGILLVTAAGVLGMRAGLRHARHACPVRPLADLAIWGIVFYAAAGLGESVLTAGTVFDSQPVTLLNPIPLLLVAGPIGIACKCARGLAASTRADRNA